MFRGSNGYKVNRHTTVSLVTDFLMLETSPAKLNAFLCWNKGLLVFFGIFNNK